MGTQPVATTCHWSQVGGSCGAGPHPLVPSSCSDFPGFFPSKSKTQPTFVSEGGALLGSPRLPRLLSSGKRLTISSSPPKAMYVSYTHMNISGQEIWARFSPGQFLPAFSVALWGTAQPRDLGKQRRPWHVKKHVYSQAVPREEPASSTPGVGASVSQSHRPRLSDHALLLQQSHPQGFSHDP